MYKALFAFSGQDGEMALAADDLVELVEKDDNGERKYLVRSSPYQHSI